MGKDLKLSSGRVLVGDCLVRLADLDDASIDSVVTDPPYELGFIKWDASGIAYQMKLWEECLRVLKPCGHLLAFGGTRTYHRMACAIEDAGFEIRDSIHWMYGCGFPKSLNVSKAIDKQRHEGQPSPNWAKREVVGTKTSGIPNPDEGPRHTIGASKAIEVDVTAAATDEARRWKGWGTALKPAHEPIVMARKPLDRDDIYKVTAWIRATRDAAGISNRDIDDAFGFHGMAGHWTSSKSQPTVPTLEQVPQLLDVFGLTVDEVPDDIRKLLWNLNGKKGTVAGNVLEHGTGGLNIDGCRVGGQDGRWPANIMLDSAAADALDQQNEGAARYFTQADYEEANMMPFIYQAKPSKAERNAGLEGLEKKVLTGRDPGQDAYNDLHPGARHKALTKVTGNTHPTVKPVALMRHLVRLVTPPGGTVLDPFLGSGTTAVAATLEGFRWVGCEMNDDYLPIIQGRVAWAEAEVKAGRANKPQYKNPAPKKPKPAQPTLEDQQQQ